LEFLEPIRVACWGLITLYRSGFLNLCRVIGCSLII
jgi:hypothetical protein